MNNNMCPEKIVISLRESAHCNVFRLFKPFILKAMSGGNGPNYGVLPEQGAHPKLCPNSNKEYVHY